MELRGNRQLKFFCQDCLDGLASVPKIRKDLSDLQTQFTDLTTQLNDLRAKFESLNDSAAINIAEPVSSLPKTSSESVIREISDRQQRVCNLMIFNLKKSNDDERLISQLFDEIEANPVQIKQVSRVGKPNKNGHQALRIVLDNPEQVKQVLKGKTKLDKSRGIYINADLTPDQRDYLNTVKSQLRDRIAGGETDLTISYVRGTPQIIKKN